MQEQANNEETKNMSEQVAGYDPGHQYPNIVDEQAGEKFDQSKIEANQNDKKEAPIAVAPRHIGKAKIKKGPSFDELQKTKAIADVKLWSQKVLEAQIASKVCSKEMKEACEAELKVRKEKRESILNK